MSRQLVHTSARGRARAAAAAALLLVAGLFASSLGAAPSGAATPPSLLVSVSTDNSALEGAPGTAIPAVLAAKGDASILVTITVSDGTDLTKGTLINLTPLSADATPPLGSFSPNPFKVPDKGSTFTFPVSYSAAEDGVALEAALKKSTTSSPTPGQSAFFDVLDSLKFTQKGDPSLATGLGADTCNTKSTVSVCGVVVLPNGIASAAAALSSGVCSDAGCTGGKEVQFIAGLTDDTGADLYSRTNPATFILQCDKTKCHGTGVPNFSAKVSPNATGALTVAPACTTKGVIQDTEDFCTDYQNSHRNNAGDLLLAVLFFKDFRGTI